MKRILLPAGGAILATGLLAAGLASTAQADSTVSADVLAAQEKAADVLSFWTDSNNAAMTKAVAFNPDALEVSKISSGGGYTSDTKPGSTAPIGEEKKVAAKVQNVNLPKTIGKVFFEGRDGKLYWCSGTSIQSQYRNLVATAAHCVYDIAGNDEVVSRWVFVPGYYQSKAPFGVYVGKQAFTHYDFDVYEDFDRDYAFVTVYDGIGGVLNAHDKVTYNEYRDARAKGLATNTKKVEITEAEYTAKNKGADSVYYDTEAGSAKKVTGPEHPGAIVDKLEVTKTAYDNATKTGRGTGFQFGAPVVEQVDQKTAEDYAKKQGWESGAFPAVGNAAAPGTVAKDGAGNYTITHYYVQDWFVPATSTKYYRIDYYVVSHKVRSVGRLGDVVGGQGFAWNQPAGKPVRAFGYPYGPHLDGNKPFTGVTPKWCYGPTAKKALLIPSKKVEEQMSLKCTVTAGFDGGPWLYKYSNAKRLGYVNGVTSLIADVDGNKRYDTITSAYFDGETNVVYQAAAKSWSGKLIP